MWPDGMPPLDNQFDGNQFFYAKAQWRLAFAWLPHRCDLSGQLIWLQNAYVGTAVWSGPGTPVDESHWLGKEEYLIWRLKHG